MKKIVLTFLTIICCTVIVNAQGNNKTNGTVVIERQDADALLVSNSTIDESYLLGDGAEVTFDGDFVKLAVDGETHQYELSESDALNINFSHSFKLTAIQDPNNTANYFATFYTNEGAYKLPEGVKAYIGVVGKSGENNVVVPNEIDPIIHKSEAVILQTNSENITLLPSSNKNAAAEGNALTGSDESKNLVTGDYALFSDLNNFGFYKWDDKTIAANNAYLNLGENKGDIFYLARVVSYVTTDENIKVPNDTIIIDSKITNEPTVSKTGYRLDGWYKESTFENKWDFATDVVTENITLYAQWIQQFTVTFVTNGAVETIESQTIDINQKVTEPSVSKTGCELRGWYSDEEFKTVWNFASDVVTADTTLYAFWHQHVGVAQSLAATCESDGYAEYFVCECGKAFTTVDCTTEITDLAAWKVGDGLIPALNHDYVLGEWSWKNDNSAASVSFVCKNDDSHVENVDATITTDTVQVICTEDGKISYFAVATFQEKDYKDTVETILPAINHDYALGEWTWKNDKSEAIVSFICKNDETHVENIDAVITTDTVAATTDENGKITYTATVEFDGETYTDTKEDIIPAIGHEFVFGKWLWADDKASCAAVFNCVNEENHADTVVATVTADTLKATCTADGLISYFAVATFNGEEYKDTVTTTIPALNHDYVLGEWSWKDDNSAASVSFVCENDDSHVENVDATITTDTVQAICTEDGKISYFAVATFNGEEYKDTVETILPAINHDYALGKWTWKNDKSEASVSFICKNDETHVENIDAVITTDTVAATTDENGKITYTATAEFDGETYTDTKEDIIPAIGHEFVFGKWLWADDNASCAAVFNCVNEENHADTVVATVTADTLKATCTADGLISYFAVATFNGEEYKDTVETILPAINHDFALGKWTWKNDKSEASVSFICKNDETHVENIDAVITTDTLAVTTDENGKITYTATAEFDGETYTDTKEDIIPAIGHEFVFGKWLWADDKASCAAVFNCVNEENHADTVVATVTVDTLKATCTADGLISYFAVASFNGEEYKDTVETILPAINHDFALDKWLWSDDKSQCSAIFVCANDKQHADSVFAVVTSDTTAATLTENGKIVYIASVTYEENKYGDTTEVILYPLVSYEGIINMIEGTYTLTSYTGDENNRPAKDLYFKFYGTDTITQGHFNNIEYNNLNVGDLTNIVVSGKKVSFDYKSNTTFSFAFDAESNTSTEVTIKNNELEQVCVLTKTPVEEINIADIWDIIEGSYINENGKVQNFIMEFDSEMGKDTPCFMWVDQFNGAEGFENVDGYFPLAGDEYISIEKTGNYYDFKISDEKYFTLTIENYVVTGFMTYGYDDEDVFKGNYKKLAYSDILEEIQGTYYLTTINGESKTENVQVDFEDENFIIIRNGKVEQKTLVENISRIMYMSDSIAILFKDNSMFAFNIDSDTIAKFILTSGGNVLEFSPNNPDPKEPEAVSELTDNITVFVRNSNIVVSGLTHDDVVTINTIDGKLLYKQLQKVETAIYDIYGKGIYFVKVGNRTFTVLY